MINKEGWILFNEYDSLKMIQGTFYLYGIYTKINNSQYQILNSGRNDKHNNNKNFKLVFFFKLEKNQSQILMQAFLLLSH